MKKRFEVIVKGLVQGVGFRYFCFRKAQEFNVKGYVRNLINGDVELQIEADEGHIKDFVMELKKGPFGAEVRRLILTELDYKNEFIEFHIR